MRVNRPGGWPAVVLVVTVSWLPSGLVAQSADRIWGRVVTVSGEEHEGFIRWDRNEGGWADILDGYKETEPFEFQDWWRLAHPEGPSRDRVVELMGYRITWDDDTPRFPPSVESGIRIGHIRRLVPDASDPERARLELQSGLEVVLRGGATDLGPDLRGILVSRPEGAAVELEWEDLALVDFFPAPGDTSPTEFRLFGTVYLSDGSSFTGFITWDMEKIFSSDRLEGRDRGGTHRQIPFRRIVEVRSLGADEGASILLTDGARLRLSDSDDVNDGNDGILVSDPALGQVEVEWEELDRVRFHTQGEHVASGRFGGRERLFGTVLTSDSSQLTGWIRWDGDEEYGWELLNGRNEVAVFQVELGLVSSIGKNLVESTAVNLGPGGMTVNHPMEEAGSRVVLADGRELVLDGSNDVDENNHGIFVLPPGGWDPSGPERAGRAKTSGSSEDVPEMADPSDPDAEWIWIRWEDFLEVRFHGPDEEVAGGGP